jgi:hypothetical protein
MTDNDHEDMADYLLDNYGACLAEPCACRKRGWRGRACENWKSCGARTLDELRDAQKCAT